MGDWLLNLTIPGMAVVIFAVIYLLAACVYWVVTRLAVDDRAKAFKAVSPGMLPPLGILFALLVGFIAVEVWNNYDKAKLAVASEASALRAVVLLAETFPEEQKTRIDALIDRHIEDAINKEWPMMARGRATLATMRANALIETLKDVITLKPADDSQRIAQPEMIKAVQAALEARRQRIVVSQSEVGRIKWAGILLQGLCTLIAIAMVHSDNRLTNAIALTLFATGIALSVLLIAAYSRPFTGEISVRPDLLKQVLTSGAAP
jgi:amino acid transporter